MTARRSLVVLAGLVVACLATHCATDPTDPPDPTDTGSMGDATDVQPDTGADSDDADQDVDPDPDAAPQPDADTTPDATPAVDPTVTLDWSAGAGFYDRPFPCASRMDPAGRVDLTGFPNPRGNAFVNRLLALLQNDARGFGITSGVFLTTSTAVDSGSLPNWEASTGDDASVFLVRVDGPADGALVRMPVTVAFEEDGGPYGAPNLLSVLPYQGVPLQADALYAAVVTTDVRDVEGQRLTQAAAVRGLLRDEPVAGLTGDARDDYRTAIQRLQAGGVDPAQIAGLAVYRTGDPREGLRAAAVQVAQLPLPILTDVAADEVFADYCVVSARVQLPVFQAGTPPFQPSGGAWAYDDAGRLVQQGTEAARVVFTVPRATMPPEGWPAVVFIRTGGGGDRPLVDRGRRAVAGGPAEFEGEGLAHDFARVGVLGVSVDGPHGGLRNVTGGDEQLLIFNIANPVAMRDNLRQSAIELMLLARMLPEVRLPAGLCDTASEDVRIDADTIGLFGHSMGATIAPSVLAYAPAYRAAVLSGAGGSWIANVVYKELPLRTRPLAEAIVGYGARRALTPHDITLSLLQWAGEPADPPVYGSLLQSRPEAPLHLLVVQGVADTYILPPMANALQLTLGADLVGRAHDATHPVTAVHTPLVDVLPLVGGQQLAPPVADNRGARTAAVVQHLQDGIEDGHEVAFQREEAKHQIRCFLAGFVAGAPVVVAGQTRFGACPE